ncbi:hypothetical protein B7R56_00290, partial [Pseudomonas savastanoi pv. retacarpa]
TSGEYFGSFFIAPSSQRLESPRNPGRFKIIGFSVAFNPGRSRSIAGRSGWMQVRLQSMLVRSAG